ncbi:MAG: hypothetical protein KDA60_13350, partial [Planctomycetales bacterium]|nr:hypothetical protein [Planctomycetales bacterium]
MNRFSSPDERAVPNRLRRYLLALWFIGIVLWSSAPLPALAGGGPENVFLVVNARSWASQTIANHYVQLRNIPPANVFYLDWAGAVDEISVATFRSEILLPTLRAIDERRLAGQIDYVVYSADLPFSVDFSADGDGSLQFVNASLTSMTYLYPLVLSKKPTYSSHNVNWYMPGHAEQGGELNSQGFRGQRRWRQGGKIVPDNGQIYLLSTMLGCTSGRGNSVDEVIRYLRRSAAADGTCPPGTIYFANSGDENRNKARALGVPHALRLLSELGVQAESIRRTYPRDRRDVMGAMMGIANYRWEDSGSRLLPGAICENFTSFGGNLRANGHQTPLTVPLRFGAAGSSGTVAEPLAFLQKFPDPALYVHYARGCSLAESFYQSVSTPFQLLIVGDPLCQPWAIAPWLEVLDLAPGQSVQGEVSLSPQVRGDVAVEHFELFIDGRRLAEQPPGTPFVFDSTQLADGYHELRVVAVSASSVESQGRLILPIQTQNHGRS